MPPVGDAAERPLRLALHADAARLVTLRARVLAALRACLESRGLVEADVGALAPFAGQEPELHPPGVRVEGLPGPLWLQTSPELLLKRLVWAGVPAVYALGPAYRGGFEELSTEHQPEFLMLEWYRPGDHTDLLVDDVVALVAAAAGALGEGDQSEQVPGAGTSDVETPSTPRVLTMAQAFDECGAGDLAALLAEEPSGTAAVSERFHRIIVETIEPALRRAGGLVFLRDYPLYASALARIDAARGCALRVEAYLGGIELANGWVELTDADSLAERWQAEGRGRDGVPPALDEGLIALYRKRPAPQTVGMALGVDRLLMALLGASRLADVRPLTLERDA